MDDIAEGIEEILEALVRSQETSAVFVDLPLAKAVEWLEGLDDGEREAAMPPVLKHWAKGLRQTAAAVEYAFENASQDAQENLFDDLLALKYGSAIPFELQLRMANVGEGVTLGRKRFVGGWMWEGDMAAAVEWVAARPSSER